MQFFLVIVLGAVFTATAVGPLGKEHPSPEPSAANASSADALFSRRALRRARLLIQMRMLQLREVRLECAREAILRRLPPDLRPTGSTLPDLKQSGASRARSFRSALPLKSEDCGWVSMQRERRRPTA